MCTLVIAARDDESIDKLENVLADLSKDGAKGMILRTKPIDISSTELRNMIRDGKDCKEYLPQSVSSYILKHRLYTD